MTEEVLSVLSVPLLGVSEKTTPFSVVLYPTLLPIPFLIRLMTALTKLTKVRPSSAIQSTDPDSSRLRA